MLDGRAFFEFFGVPVIVAVLVKEPAASSAGLSVWVHMYVTTPSGSIAVTPCPTGDRAGIAVRVLEFAEGERRVARVGDLDLVVDGLTDLAAQRGCGEWLAAARDRLQLLDREGGGGDAGDVARDVEVAADPVGAPPCVDVDEVVPDGADNRDRLGRCAAVEFVDDRGEVRAAYAQVLDNRLPGKLGKLR